MTMNILVQRHGTSAFTNTRQISTACLSTMQNAHSMKHCHKRIACQYRSQGESLWVTISYVQTQPEIVFCFLQLQFTRISSKVSLLLCQQSTKPRVQKRIQWCASMAQIVKHEQALLARALRRVDARAKLLVLVGAIRVVVDVGV